LHDGTAARTRAPALRRSARRTVVKRIPERTPLVSPRSTSHVCVTRRGCRLTRPRCGHCAIPMG
jgi:hypothetical protein